MPKSVNEWEEADLIALIGTEENTELEFKNGGALVKSPKRNAEICKDVSSMANAAGGVIIYGMSERDKGGTPFVGIADSLDGCDPALINVDQIYQIINGGIEPRLSNVEIRRVPLHGNLVAFVIEIPQSHSFSPHQVRDNFIYYRRYGSQILAMYDHEIRDVMRRSTSPDLYANLLIGHGNGDQFPFQVKIGNRSDSPATTLLVQFTGERRKDFQIEMIGWDVELAPIAFQGRPLYNFSTTFGQSDLPLFKEFEKTMLRLTIILPQGELRVFGYRLSCPGFNVQKLFKISRDGTAAPQIDEIDYARST